MNNVTRQRASVDVLGNRLVLLMSPVVTCSSVQHSHGVMISIPVSKDTYKAYGSIRFTADMLVGGGS
uniref:Uncharacterized protein n=1 Tax=Peronospora matthiolae TaxID=2874970 RepID=A0AAV1UKX6_9STRA